MNKVDLTKKNKFTMEVATDTLELLDLKPKFGKESKQIYVALRFRWIYDTNEKFEKHSAEYQNYLIARDYKPGKVKKTIFRH